MHSARVGHGRRFFQARVAQIVAAACRHLPVATTERRQLLMIQNELAVCPIQLPDLVWAMRVTARQAPSARAGVLIRLPAHVASMPAHGGVARVGKTPC